jgi:tetratricopeptide (TPR) repeat protein/S1-C subfamily serine protease
MRRLLVPVLAGLGGALVASIACVVLLRSWNKTPARAAETTVAADVKVPAKVEADAAPTQPTSSPVVTSPSDNGQVKPALPQAQAALITDSPKVFDLTDLAEKVGPSVVQLNVSGPAGAKSGSGFVIDKQGRIVTNYHVIEDATEGTVVFSDKSSARITGYSGAWPEKDIAVVCVQCPPDKLHPLDLATSPPRQGERVAAFGSPLGFSRSLSEGIVSAVRQGKELEALIPWNSNTLLIQTTAPISHGSSGGPLVNMKGMVVGVNTLTFQPQGQSASPSGENLNFAVSATELQPVQLGQSKTILPLPASDMGQSTASRVRRILDRAWKRSADELDKVIADYSEAIAIDPKCAVAYWGRGLANQAKGDYEKAVADFTEAIRLEPTSARVYGDRGRTYELKGDCGKAIADYTEAIRLEPKAAEFYCERGGAYYIKGDHPSAIADFTEAIRLDPKIARAYFRRGLVYNEKRDYEMAISDFTEAIRLQPRVAILFFDRGSAYEGKGDYDTAIADFTDAIRLDPNLSVAYFERGFAYGSKGGYDKAVADYTEAIRLDPKNALAYYNRAVMYQRKGERLKSETDLAEAKRLGLPERSNQAAGQANEAEGNTAVHEGPVVPDADGQGWTQRSGNVVRGFRDGVTFKITRVGNVELYENNEGSTGTRVYNDKRKVSTYSYKLPARGFNIVGEDPYPGNNNFEAWSKRTPVGDNSSGSPSPSAPNRGGPGGMGFRQVGPFVVPNMAYGPGG